MNSISKSARLMPQWLFRRFTLRRALQNPVRLTLLVCAVAVATTLVASVLRVSVAGVDSFEDSLGLSAEEYPLVVSPRGGRIQLGELDRCLAPLRNTFAIAAYRRDVGEVVTERGRHAVAVVGLTGVQDGDEAPSEGGDILVSDRMARELAIRPGSALEVLVDGGGVQGKAGHMAQLSTALPPLAVVVPLDSRPITGRLLSTRSCCVLVTM